MPVPELTVIATAHAKPGMGPDLLREMQANVINVHREDGCLHYTLHQALDDSDTIVVIERWASEQALAAHAAAPHMRDFSERAAQYRARPTDVRRYEMIPADGLPDQSSF